MDEARNAQCAREMLQRGEWIVPTFNEELRTDKPPLHYYFMMLAYKFFGVTEFAARFFSAVFGIATIMTSYFFTARFMGQPKGFLVALILLSSFAFTFEMRYAVPDPYFIFFVSTGLFSLFTFLSGGTTTYLWVFYACIGLGFLCKGPIAVILPVLILFVFLVIDRKFSLKTILNLCPFRGALIILMVTLPWYAAVHHATNGKWTRDFLFEQNLRRFIAPIEGHGGPYLLTALFGFIGLLPFSVFVIQAVNHARKRWKDPLIKFSAVAASTYLLFFSIAQTKLPHYLLPAYPFYALLLAGFIHDRVSAHGLSGSLPRSPFIIYFVLACMMPVMAYLWMGSVPPLSHLTHLALYFALFPAGALLAFYFYLKDATKAALISMSAPFVLIVPVFFGFLYPLVLEKNPVKQVISTIDETKPVVAYQRYNEAFNFYVNKPIPRFVNAAQLKQFVDLHPDYILITRKDLLHDLTSLGGQVVFTGHDVLENYVTVIVKGKQ